MHMRVRLMHLVTPLSQMTRANQASCCMLVTLQTEYLQTMVPIQILKVMEYLMVL